jgi:hypothetical protein
MAEALYIFTGLIMGQLIDQIKVWHAMRDERSGVIDYDRLARAGLLGEVVLHNMLGRIIDSATVQNRERLERLGDRGVSLGMGGTTTYTDSGLMVSDAIGLTVAVGDPSSHQLIVAKTNVSYRLAGEKAQDWDFTEEDLYWHDGPRTIIQGEVSGEFGDLERRVANDFRDALTDPSQFILNAAVNALDIERLNSLADLLDYQRATS